MKKKNNKEKIKLNKIITKAKDNKLVLIAFLLMFIIGLISLKNVGGYFDEDSEKRILLMNYMSYAEKFNVGNSYIKELKKMDLVPISESVERDHGIAPYYPYILFFNIKSDYLSSVVWHAYTFILCFIGLIFLFLLLQKLLKNKYLSLLLSATYFFSPRIFADSLYNNKDMILLSFLIIGIYFVVKLLEKKNYKNAIILGIICAIICNIKVIGFYFFGIIGLTYIINLIRKKEFNKKNFLIGCSIILSWLIVYILITPAIWCGNKFCLIEHIQWGLQESSNFSRLKPTVYFEGIYHLRDTNPLPWYYIPKMIIITSPVIITILFLLSTVLVIYNLIRKIIKREQLDNILIISFMSLVMFITPLIVSMVSKPNVYNGWRHFYFLYGLIIIVSAYGLYTLQKNTKTKKVTNTIMIVALIYYICGNLINGIGGMTYYSFLVAGNHPTNYETDYYGVTTKHSMELMLDKIKDKEVYIYSKEHTSAKTSLFVNTYKLPEKYKKRVKLIATKKRYKKLKSQNKKVLYFYNVNYNKKDEVKGLKKISTYKSWNTTISEFYE